jgi:DNA repair exonuclease SbcCD ATPase subunit
MPSEPEPYGRDEYRNALIANAATKPFNLALLVGTTGAGIAVGGTIALVLVVAVIVYLAAVARTFFDGDEADRVLARERADRRERLASSTKRLDVDTLAPPIRVHLFEARTRERKIREAIEKAELPYAEVSDEVDGFVRVLEQTAARAQLLYEALADTPVARVSERLAEVRGRRGERAAELIEALEHQLRIQRRMEAQLKRFYDEMERIVVELDTVRGNLVSVSASTDAATQKQLASDVRGLRERVGAISDGINEAYEATP